MNSHLDIKVGWNCNHNCIHCVVADKKSKIEKQNFSLDELKSIIDRHSNCDKITITGGEPTIRKDIIEIAQYIKEKNNNCHVDLQTNGTGLSNPYVAEGLARYIDVFFIAVHSFDKNVHDGICRRKGSWDETIEGIVNLLSIRNRKFFVDTQTVISKYNMNTLNKTFDFFNDIGINASTLTFPHAMGNVLDDFYGIVPKYSDIKDSIDYILSNYDKSLRAEAIPACYLTKHPGHLEEALTAYNGDYVYDRCVELVNTPDGYEPLDDFRDLIKKDYMKPESCAECVYDRRCMGVWKEYIQYYGQEIDLFPIRND